MAETEQGRERRAATGVVGIDELTRGGFPAGRTTLVAGGPGSGKTVLALQSLVHGASLGEPGVFVCFEESTEALRSNASSFPWFPADHAAHGISLLDARSDLATVTLGDFDLEGLLATLQTRVEQIGARRIVLDAADALLYLFDDERSVRRELLRLQSWLPNKA